MKYSSIILTGILASGAQIVQAEDAIISVNSLDSLGISQQLVHNIFTESTGVTLNPFELLKVSADNEGKNFKFETLDHLSIVVPIAVASGGFNKVVAESFKKND